MLDPLPRRIATLGFSSLAIAKSVWTIRDLVGAEVAAHGVKCNGAVRRHGSELPLEVYGSRRRANSLEYAARRCTKIADYQRHTTAF
jgi:hypothetical protein